jgi:hypothetical protein
VFHVDGQTDKAKLMIALRNYAKTPKTDGKLLMSLPRNRDFIGSAEEKWE